ncbi:iron chelate uptake ABC transporter family permease subunit [Pseudonocardia tropica]|uniref:Iron chelate uptake ABC transporter family permease subunit n=1 Tax=Pseudonocardia tropica TaxID=681289 RepID=A0ABV1JYT6_9PSEU
MSVSTAAPPARPAGRRSPAAPRAAGLVALTVLLAAACLASLCVGAESVSPATVWSALWRPDGGDTALIVGLRVPRMLLGLLCGLALGLAGALMQGLTRNPLADPGLLGVDSGAAAAIVLAIAVLGVSTPGGYVWFAVAGAAAASVLVYLLGSAGRAATPERTVLAGAAVSAVLRAVVLAVLVLDAETFDAFRSWDVGSLAGRDAAVLADTAPLMLAGAVLALSLTRPLNVLALGDDTGRALGARLTRVRIGGIVAITLLCGAATAAVGPIGFVGLVVPHAARLLVGADQRWVLPYAALLAPVLLLLADVVGRLALYPSELQVGLVTAFLGAPVFIALCRRRRIGSL